MISMRLARLLLVILLAAGCFCVIPASRAQQSRNSTTFEKTVQPFLARNCYSCHNSGLESGNLNLEKYKSEASVVADPGRWSRIYQRLKSGEMPPAGMPRPNQAELQTVFTWIGVKIPNAETPASVNPGRVTARRLNRAEYNNTVRDLLGVDMRLADDFPQDDSGYGFDNIGDVLSISPVLMENYLAAAEKISRAALFGPDPLKPTLVRYEPRGRRIVTSMTPLLEYDTTGLSLPNGVHATHRFPVDGEYVFRIILGGERPGGSEPLQLAFWIDGLQVSV